ncbi:hypothetical protein K1719_029727 [Acacia pycnantha]|nr:hypothetical protein K1719_029727 [Acacia pycnantha]
MANIFILELYMKAHINHRGGTRGEISERNLRHADLVPHRSAPFRSLSFFYLLSTQPDQRTPEQLFFDHTRGFSTLPAEFIELYFT